MCQPAAHVPALSTRQVQSFREPHASAIARLGGALGLPDEQINALTALSTLKLRFYRHSATAIADLSKAARIASAQRDLIHPRRKLAVQA